MSQLTISPDAFVERLEWTVIRRLDGLFQGDYRTLFRGFGLDLADLREYQLYDDIRHIDWNVTARLNTPYVRQYNEDREVTAWFLLDVSPSVDFGSTNAAKRTKLLEFFAVLARLLSRHGNRLGVMLYTGNAANVIPVGAGRRHLLYALKTVMDQPELDRAPPTDLRELLVAAHRIITRRSLLFLVSDFYSADGWLAPLGHLAQRHEVLAVRVFDPLELDLPDLGLITMQDAETGEQLLVDTHDTGFRERFGQLAAEHQDEIRSAFQRAGVDALELSTEDDMVEAIIRFASLRTLTKPRRLR
jgi:uncharacterized protein (DUF58 family)